MQWKYKCGAGMSAAAGVAGLALGSIPTTSLPGRDAELQEIDDSHSNIASSSLDILTSNLHGDRNKSTALPEIRLPEEQAWGDETGERFDVLARKEALGSISQSEYAELETLSRNRRSVRQARSGLELIEAYRRSMHIAGMLDALESYVEFEKRPHRAR